MHTVQRQLVKNQLYGRVSRATPLISNPNGIKRLGFAYEHLNLNVYDSENYLFSDETKYNLINSDGKTYVRRWVGEEFDKQCTKK